HVDAGPKADVADGERVSVTAVPAAEHLKRPAHEHRRGDRRGKPGPWRKCRHALTVRRLWSVHRDDDLSTGAVQVVTIAGRHRPERAVVLDVEPDLVLRAVLAGR